MNIKLFFILENKKMEKDSLGLYYLISGKKQESVYKE